MTVTDLLNSIKAHLKRHKAEIANGMVEGRVNDFYMYQKHVGIAEGLERACGVIDDIFKQIDKEEDEKT
jgi:hypothetical protein